MWTTKITLDKDKDDVATATATFTDANGTFTHSARVRITAAERDAFINECISLRNSWRERKTAEAGYETNVNNRFLTLDN